MKYEYLNNDKKEKKNDVKEKKCLKLLLIVMMRTNRLKYLVNFVLWQ